MSSKTEPTTFEKLNIKGYLSLIETVVKVEIKRFNAPHIIDYSELLNIGVQVVHHLSKSADMNTYNTSYISTAIKWAIRNEIRRRHKWYSLKTKGEQKLKEEEQNEIREIVYKTILSVDELAEADNPTIIKDRSRTPAENSEFLELSVILKEAVKKLPPRERELIECKFFKEKKLREISEEYNISQSRVSRIIQSGLNKLKKELQKSSFAD